MSKSDVCALHVVALTESWQQEPLFATGTSLPFSTGSRASQSVLTYVNNLSPQKLWRVGGGHKYFASVDGKRIVKIMYLVCTKSGKECVQQEKEPTKPTKLVNVNNQRKTAFIEGTRASKCGCKAKIQVNWVSEDAAECQIGDCSWEHLGSYLPTRVSRGLSSSRSLCRRP